ncbi:PLP-dependent transferase [Roridomyces roridus]|uniref:PLP-dependent transferase n=1 Tax=Roridomyces roridus TaxID=1738132 RepID=A0AAD7C6S9_9AGAR|nr:PLP-dependent transferase [Roridomyces roridus]
MSPLPPLSNRAVKRLGFPPPHAYAPPPGPFHDPELYPDSCINLSIAENSLLSPRLIEHFSRPITTLRTQHLRYRATLIKSTLPTVEDLLPQYINDHIHPRVPVTRDNSVAGPGIGAVLAQAVWALAGEGEGVLMSAPFYDDYVRDIMHPALAVLMLAEIPADVDSLSTDALPYLERKILESERLGIKIRVMLIPNPHNPIPQIVPSETIKGYALLAQKYNIHLIVDEVYGLSTYRDSAYPPAANEPFESVLTYDLAAMGVDPERVHVLTSPTKDFGASGLKLGLFISPANPQLINLIRPLFLATPISSVSDLLFARVLQDRPFVERFLEDNRRMVKEAYEFAAGWLTFHGLEFTRANAGVYVVVDFAPFLDRIAPAHLAPLERLDIAVAAIIREGVFIKPTNLMADPVQTRFRLIFTQARPIMIQALRRLEKAFKVPEAPLDETLPEIDVDVESYSDVDSEESSGVSASATAYTSDSESSVDSGERGRSLVKKSVVVPVNELAAAVEANAVL